MELKKFEAPTLAQALQVVKRELGPEAIILSTKNKRSALGLMNRSSVEVTAAVSPEAFEKKQAAERNMNPQQKEILQQSRNSQKVTQAYDVFSGRSINQDISRFGGTTHQKTAAPSKTPTSTITQRRYVDIADDENPAEQATMRSQDKAQVSPQARHASGHSPAVRVADKATTGILSRLMAQLLEGGVEADIVRELGDELKTIMLREHITREDILRMQLARVLMSRLRVARPLGERLRIPNTARMISFVGPTGVGKTTTVAKIAAELVINQKRPVTLATTDTFKIAAVEQLQTYANILRVPLEVCPTAESLAHLSASLGPDDVILVDTAGYGPRDEKKLNELLETLSSVRTETHLCVAATTRDYDLVEIARRFKVFDPDYLVVTKLDETSIFGNLFNISLKSHLPLSYLTMGQRVPEDIEVATKERVADLLLNIAGGV